MKALGLGVLGVLCRPAGRPWAAFHFDKHGAATPSPPTAPGTGKGVTTFVAALQRTYGNTGWGCARGSTGNPAGEAAVLTLQEEELPRVSPLSTRIRCSAAVAVKP